MNFSKDQELLKKRADSEDKYALGNVLDHWALMPNDLKSSIEAQDENFFRAMQELYRVMEQDVAVVYQGCGYQGYEFGATYPDSVCLAAREAAEARVKELEKYAQHAKDCEMFICAGCSHGRISHTEHECVEDCFCTGFRSRPCTCGLSALLEKRR